MQEQSLFEKILAHQKTLYLVFVLLLVSLGGFFMLLSVMKTGASTEAQASPSPSVESLNLSGAQTEQPDVAGAQTNTTAQQPVPVATKKATPKPTVKPTAAPTGTPTPTSSPTPSPTNTPGPTNTPEPTASPTPSPTESPVPTATPG